MTKSEYRDLIDFLGKRFDAVDRRFSGMEDRLTRVEVFGEESRHQIQLLAEGLQALRSEMRAGFQDQTKLLLGLADRVQRLEVHLA